jgi:hypothetical protein
MNAAQFALPAAGGHPMHGPLHEDVSPGVDSEFSAASAVGLCLEAFLSSNESSSCHAQGALAVECAVAAEVEDQSLR